MAGIAANERYAIVADRELDDSIDAFLCLRTDDGSEVWSVRYPAAGNLDYGNSPRATPLIEGGRVYLLGAFGHLRCHDLVTGELAWEMNLREKFKVDDKLVWGVCSSPLIADGKLIVNPGGPDASLVALDPATGAVVWQSPGKAAAFSSFIVANFGGRRQLVGYDVDSVGGWDPATGERIWALKPTKPKDFNVPTPIVHRGQLILASENNGTRVYAMASNGKPKLPPVAMHRELAPDSHTPVVVGNRLFGVWNALYCLQLDAGLKPAWDSDDAAFAGYATLIASDNRVLCVSQEGELILLDANASSFKPLSRVQLFADERGVYAHPAIVGKHMLIRNSTAIVCIALEDS